MPWDNFLDFGSLPGMVENRCIGNPVLHIDQRFAWPLCSIQTGQLRHHFYSSNTKPQYNVQFEVECNLSLPFQFWRDDKDLESDSGSDSATTESNLAISSTPGASSFPQESISVSDYTTAIQASATVYGSSEQTVEIRAMNHNTGKYSKTLTLTEERFVEALS